MYQFAVHFGDETPNRIHIVLYLFMHPLYNLVNVGNLVHNLFLVHLSISICFERLVPIIRRNNCIYATLGAVWSGMQG
jgi:hypothetical protein